MPDGNDNQASGVERFALDLTDKYGHDYGLVAVEAEDESAARRKFEEEYEAWEVTVQTLPHEGETTETVFARSEDAAEEIAVGRRGDYSDVPQETVQFLPETRVESVRRLQEPSSREEDRAVSELRCEQFHLDQEEENDHTRQCAACGDEFDPVEDTHYRVQEEERPVPQLEKDEEDLEFEDWFSRGWFLCRGCWSELGVTEDTGVSQSGGSENGE